MQRLFFAGLENACFHFTCYANSSRRLGKKSSGFRTDEKINILVLEQHSCDEIA